MNSSNSSDIPMELTGGPEGAPAELKLPAIRNGCGEGRQKISFRTASPTRSATSSPGATRC
ncbi:MAG: hypothetical protein MZV63_68365 [Marinilabiliales bacterium]|nr:hypothetical protein [Marinilabiliales bacterium]